MVLPERLAYLRPVLDELDAVAPDDLHEDHPTAHARIEAALRQRIAGLTPAKAKRTLAGDKKSLKRWLDANDSSHAGNFIYHSFFDVPGIVDVLLEDEPQPPPPKFHVTITLPEGYRAEESPAGELVLKSAALEVTITPIDTALLNPLTLLAPVSPAFVAQFFPGGLPYVDSDIQCGQVVGKKRLTVIKRPTQFLKGIHYVLEVPGGWVSIVVQRDQNFDETPLETAFATLQVRPHG